MKMKNLFGFFLTLVVIFVLLYVILTISGQGDVIFDLRILTNPAFLISSLIIIAVMIFVLYMFIFGKGLK